MDIPKRDLLSEMHALQVFDGHGMVRLFEVSLQQQIFLLEDSRPWTLLVWLQDDEAQYPHRKEKTRRSSRICVCFSICDAM